MINFSAWISIPVEAVVEDELSDGIDVVYRVKTQIRTDQTKAAVNDGLQTHRLRATTSSSVDTDDSHWCAKQR